MFNKYHSMSIMTIMFRICTILLFLRSVLTATPVGCDSYMNLVIALDSSESLLEGDPRDQPFRNWNLLKNLTNDVISDLAVSAGRTRIGMMTFSDRSNREFDIGEYGDEANPLSVMHNRVHALQFRGGSTHTGDALLEASDMFRELDRATSEDDDRRKVMLVLTDGLSNDREDTREQANRLKEQWHTEIFTIGVSEYVDTMELKTMSSDEDNVIHVDRFDQLVFYRQQIIHKLCKLEGPAPPPTPAPYKCDSDVILDIAFLIDSSGSIEDSGAGNYDILKDFIIRLIDQLNIGPLYNQIGAIIFSEDSKLLFDLNDYDDSENIKQTIRNATFLGSHTNIASALRMANYEIFQPQFGDRENISNVIILITDGHSTRETNLTQIEADGLSDRDVTTFVMGITRNVNVTELEGIASKPVHEHLYQVENILDLDDFVAALIQHVCKTDIARRASLELYPTSPKKEAKNRK